MASPVDQAQLAALVDRFLSGEDRTLALANEIEGVITASFQDAEWYEDASDALAHYRPSGGAYLLGEDELASVLRRVRSRL